MDSMNDRNRTVRRRMDTLKYCTTCGLRTETVLEITPDLTHYGKLVCAACGKFHEWVKKPDSDASKYRRPKQHRELVERYGYGFCELCLMSEAELRQGTVLEGHHVIEYKDGGTDDRENIWVLCTKCHRLVHWQRKYVGRDKPVDVPVEKHV